MKLRFLLILPWVLALLLSCRVALADDSFPMSAADYFDTDEVTDAIPQEGQEVLDDLGVSGWSEESLLSLTPEQFLHTTWEAFAQAFRQPARMLAVLVGAALLTMLLEGTQDLHTAKSIQPVFGAVTVLCLAAVLSVPVLVFLGCEGAALLIRSVFLPVAGVLLALGVTGSVTGDSRLQGVGKMIRRAAGWALGLVLILFIGLMTLQTSVSAAADTVTAKSAKYLLGSLIPVVGSSVSDAVMAARGCIDLIRTSVGGFGILVIAAIFLLPMVRVLAWYCAFSIGSFLGELLGAKALRSLMDSFASGFGLLLSALTAFAAVSAACTGLLLSMGGAA